MHRLHEIVGRVHQGIVLSRTQKREASARDAAAGEIDVVLYGEAREQRRDLVGPAQPAADALIGREVRDVLAEETDGAGGGREVAGDAVEQRGLAGTVGAEHGAPLAGTHGDGDVGQRGERTEQSRHAAQLQRSAGADGGEALGDAIHGGALRRIGRRLRRWRWRQRCHRPMTPSEDQNTMARKPSPIRRRKRLPSSPSRTRKSSAKVRSSTKISAPMKGPIRRVMPPTTAMISTSMQAPTLTEPGEIWR